MHTRRLWHLGLMVAVIATSTAISAGQSGAQRPTFRAAADLVSLIVTVRDKRGQFVPSLKADEFIVLEDGVPQKLQPIVLISGARELSTGAAPVGSVPEGLVVPRAVPLADRSGRVFIIFIDDLHLQASDTPRVRQLLKRITDTLIHDGDIFAVVSTGYSSIAIDPTYDRSRLTEAIKKIMGGGMTSDEIIMAPQSPQGVSELRHRAHVAFDTAYDLLAQLEQYGDRRKAFIYLSTGYDFNPFKESRLKADQERYSMMTGQQAGGQSSYTQNPFETQGQQFAQADLIAQLSELIRAANRANATFYTIDPRGLTAGPDINQAITSTEYRDHVRNSVDSLMVLGDLTGGFCICQQNDFKKGLERIDAETSDYYVLKYYSSNPDPLRRTRKVDVKVTREGMTVVARNEYGLAPIKK